MPSMTAHDKATAIGLLATGAGQYEVADAIGVNQSTISRTATKHKAEIEQLTLDIISKSVSLIRDNHLNTLTLAHNILSDNIDQRTEALNQLAQLRMDAKDILTLSDKKEERALKIMGISPAHTPSMVVNMLFQDNSTTQDSEELGIVRALLDAKRSEDVQEAEFSEVSEE